MRAGTGCLGGTPRLRGVGSPTRSVTFGLCTLETAGWEDLEEVIDETPFIVARDPEGLMWAIGVASSDGDRRGYIELDISRDDRAFDRVAFVEPLETRGPESLIAALAAFR